MIKKFSKLLFLFLFLANLCIPISCSAGTGERDENGKENENTDSPLQTGKSVAYFDSFTYKGEDDYYRTHPLPSPDSFYSAILPGWYSDPSVCTNGKGDYYLVTSTFCYFPGVPIFHSTDLVNWKQIGHVLDRPSQLINFIGQDVSGGIFAPAIEYNPHNDTYYMITTNVGGGNFFVKTKNPAGPWSEPVYLPGVQGIDPSFFFDEDGKAYIVNNAEPDGAPEYDGHRAIRIQKFDVATETTFGAPGKVIIDKGAIPADKPIWIEGPHMYKINGKYFLMSAEGGTGGWHSEVIFRGDSPMGAFVPWKNNPILTQRTLPGNRPDPITCAGHADLIQTKEGEWWAVFLACRPINNVFENLGRETFLMPVKWSEDGFPYMTQGEEVIPMIQSKKGVVSNTEVTFGNFEKKDDFTTDKLGLEWLTLRTPATDLYSLTEKPGYLTLKCSEILATEKKTPAYVGRRMQHHKFECTTKMTLDAADNKDAAGMLLFKNETHQYFFSVTQNGTKQTIAVEKISEAGSESLNEQSIVNRDKPVNLKVVSQGTHYDFYYAIGDGKWQLLCQNIDARYLSTDKCGGFTGTTIGMYSVRKQ